MERHGHNCRIDELIEQLEKDLKCAIDTIKEIEKIEKVLEDARRIKCEIEEFLKDLKRHCRREDRDCDDRRRRE